MSVKSAPAPGNYQQAAEHQAQASQGAVNAQTSANRPDQTNAFGGHVGWEQGPNGPQQTQSFGGPLGEATQGLLAQAGQLGQGMDWSQFGKMDDGSAARDQAITASYNQATSRLNPQWDHREEAQRAQLANQGLDPNSEAARSAGRELGNARNDAYGSAMNSAIGQGQAAGDSVFRNNMAARQQAIIEALRQRGQPLAELGALQGLLAQPGFHAAGAAQAPQYLQALGMQDQANLGAYSASNQANADLFGGLGQLAASGAGFAFSDERVKLDVVRLGVEALPGVPFATWRYMPEIDASGRRYVGVIAQDLERVAPRYVHARPDGIKLVDYSFLSEVSRG